MPYESENQLFVKRSQYIRIEIPLHKQSEKACMCFETRRVRTRNFTVFISYVDWWGCTLTHNQMAVEFVVKIRLEKKCEIWL